MIKNIKKAIKTYKMIVILIASIVFSNSHPEKKIINNTEDKIIILVFI